MYKHASSYIGWESIKIEKRLDDSIKATQWIQCPFEIELYFWNVVTRSLFNNVLDTILDIVFDNGCMKSSADLYESFRRRLGDYARDLSERSWLLFHHQLNSSSSRYVTQASPPMHLLTLFEEAISINSWFYTAFKIGRFKRLSRIKGGQLQKLSHLYRNNRWFFKSSLRDTYEDHDVDI